MTSSSQKRFYVTKIWCFCLFNQCFPSPCDVLFIDSGYILTWLSSWSTKDKQVLNKYVISILIGYLKNEGYN